MKTITLQSLINFDIGDIVILNQDYKAKFKNRTEEKTFDRLKICLGTIVEISDSDVRIRYKEENKQKEYKWFNYKRLGIIRKRKL